MPRGMRPVTSSGDETPCRRSSSAVAARCPIPERAGPSTLVRTGSGRPALRLRTRRPHARGCRRVGRRSAAWALSDPSPQRSHHRPQRHRHLALDHLVPAASAPRLRPGRHRVAPAGDRGHAGARHRLSPGPPRRSAVEAVGGGRRMRARHGAWRTARSGSPRHPPIMHRFGRLWASASRRAAGRSSSPATPFRATGWTSCARERTCSSTLSCAPTSSDRSACPGCLDVLDYHSSVEDAAQTAARNGVGTLVLTHPVPAPQPGTEPEWIALAAEHFDGTVILAHDLLTLDVGPSD